MLGQEPAMLTYGRDARRRWRDGDAHGLANPARVRLYTENVTEILLGGLSLPG